MFSGIELFLGLFNNLAFFIILVAVYGILNSYFEKSAFYVRETAIGISFGLFAIGCMHVKIPVAVGVIVDQRNAIVALSGAFGGPLSAVFCSTMTGAYRAYIGGAGTFAGVTGVCLAAVAGMGLYILREKIDGLLKWIIAALAATIVILPGFLFVGDLQTGWELLKVMTLPYGSAIFIGILFAGLLLTFEERRRSAEVELKHSEKRFRELFESLLDVSYRTDKNGNLEIISPSSEKMFGYRPEEIIGTQISDYYRYSSQRERFVAKLRQEGYLDNFEAEIRRKDGTFIWVSTNAKSLRDGEGNFIGVEGVTRDISKLKKAEGERNILQENLLQIQKMDAIGTLAGGIAHDFNNILSIVIGCTELVIEDLPEESEERDNLDTVLTAALRGKDLTYQILTFCRKGKPDKKMVEIHLIIEETAKLLKQTIPVSVKLNMDIDPQTGFLLADPTQIHQVVLNLCTNAYHALENEKGIIDIQLKPVKADSVAAIKHANPRKGDYAQLAVRDTGKGIDTVTKARIFEPFFTTKEQGKGTGMGLSVVHGIVQDHDGAIEVESTPGQGSTFRVFLPLSHQEKSKTPVSEPKPRSGSETILFVDDEPALVKLGKKHIEKLGYNVFATPSATEALEKFRLNPDIFDLIITDQTMPEMTGDLLAKRVMEIRPDIPVIICTGYSAVIDEDIIANIGVKALLIKPLEKNKLSQAVRDVLDASF